MKTVAVFVPAWNEAQTIEETLLALLAQQATDVVIATIVVIANNCTDDTAEIARKVHDKRILVLDVPNCPGKKSGAMNIAWRYLRQNDIETDVVLTVDAETILTDGSLQGLSDAIGWRRPVVCARYMPKDNRGLVRRLQALEYARFDDNRLIRDWHCQVASGAAAMYRSSVLDEVVHATGRSGPWDENSLIEDYGLTLDIKSLGYKGPRVAPQAMVLTDTPATWRELWKQRIRWGRGGVDECRRRGWNPATRRDISGYGVFLVNLMVRLLAVVYLVSLLTSGQLPTYSLIGLVPIVLMMYNRIASLKILTKRTWKDHLLVYLVLIEDAYGFFMEMVTATSILMSYRGRRQAW